MRGVDVQVTRFEDIYRQNFTFVWAAAHRCGVPSEAVDDVVQDVFLTAHRRIDELDWEVSPRGWLYAVTRNLASKHHRAWARRRRRERVVASRDDRNSHPHRRHDAARTAVALLERIDVGQREVFVQSELLGMTAPEIAADLGLPLNTVYSRLRLARRRLAALAGDEARLHQAVESLRRSQQPSVSEHRRNRAALLGRIGASWGVLSSTAMLGLVSAGAAAVVLGVALASAPPPAVDSHGATQTRSQTRTESTPEGPGRDREQPSVAAQVAPPPAPTTSPPPVVEAAPPRKPAPRSSAADLTTKSFDSLSAEVLLLDRARDALRRGDPASALELLDTYDARFPEGQLRAAAVAVRLRGRCALGSDGSGKCTGAVTEAAPGGEP